MLQDLRYALRALRTTPRFTAVAVATLAIGIAANTVVFSLLNGLALRLIPAKDPERLIRLYPIDREGRRATVFSYPDYSITATARPLLLRSPLTARR